MRSQDSEDQIWWLQHYPVYTQGTSCHHQPVENPSCIPVIHTDRGGQMTYHGPGQMVVYFLLDLKRRKIGPKLLVHAIEQLIIDLLKPYKVPATRRQGAPGLYVDGKKIAALGLRISRGYCYHGFSLNVRMDLTPFSLIDPCGFPMLEVTQLADHAPEATLVSVQSEIASLAARFDEYFRGARQTGIPASQ